MSSTSCCTRAKVASAAASTADASTAGHAERAQSSDAGTWTPLRPPFPVPATAGQSCSVMNGICGWRRRSDASSTVRSTCCCAGSFFTVGLMDSRYQSHTSRQTKS